MNQNESHKINQAAYKLVGDLFNVTALYNSNDDTILTLFPIYKKETSIKFLEDRLQLAGYTYNIQDEDDHIILRVNSKPTFKIPPINILLFFLTLFSIYVVPVYFKVSALTYGQGTFSDDLELTYQALLSGAGLIFTIAMISILFVHEMGHYIASRRRDIITSWPYFIPAPNIIGTFGAIIKSKSPFWNRRDLLEVGAWGPIAGWLVAICWLIIGLSNSEIVHQNMLQPFGGFSLEGESILMRILTLTIVGNSSPEHYYQLTEAAFAGWVGMLVTAINMLPIGQLDGGHVVYGLFKKRQHTVSYIAMAGLILLGFNSPLWWMFALMGVLFGIKHPPTLNDSKKLSKNSIILGVCSLIILFLSFTPIPFQ